MIALSFSDVVLHLFLFKRNKYLAYGTILISIYSELLSSNEKLYPPYNVSEEEKLEIAAN